MKKLIALLLALVMALSMIACGAQEETAASATEAATEAAAEAATEAAAEAAEDDKITVGINLYYKRDEYYADLDSTFKAYGAEKGYEIVITDADGDVPTQIAQIEDFITQGVDYILLAAADPDALVPVCQEAVDAGIPVICYDGGITGNDVCSTKVIFDYPENGKLAGQWICDYVDENLGGSAKVAILDFPPSASVGVPTVNGVIEVLNAHEGIEIVAQQDGKASRVDSMAAMENILTANPDLDIVYAFNLDMTIGAANAIEAAGSDCVAVGGGWGEEGFTMLENGHPIIKALVSSSPVTQAKDAIDAIGKLMAGEELPDETLSHGTLLTQETIKDFDWKSVVEARSN